uniref:Uncharacterized protein n=1 Tax=Anguilla anguilla TaxID=7936 RepID=A0A0E9WV23_ANGAN
MSNDCSAAAAPPLPPLLALCCALIPTPLSSRPGAGERAVCVEMRSDRGRQGCVCKERGKGSLLVLIPVECWKGPDEITG